MKISVVMPARNEGDEVRKTCEAMALEGADEIIVVDDASDDGSCSTLADGVTNFLYNIKYRAPAYCRNLGARAATGDVIVFCDAHVRANKGALKILTEIAMEEPCIACGSIQPLHDNPGWTGYGGILVGKEAGYSVGYQTRRPKEKKAQVFALIGSVYAVQRDVLWDNIGGWPKTISHGYNEQALSIASLLTNTPMFSVPDAVFQHGFKNTFNYPVHGSHQRINRWLVHHTLFETDTWTNVWLPEFEKKMAQVAPKAKAMLATQEYQKDHERFQKLRKIDDKRFFEIVEAQNKPQEVQSGIPTL